MKLSKTFQTAIYIFIGSIACIFTGYVFNLMWPEKLKAFVSFTQKFPFLFSESTLLIAITSALLLLSWILFCIVLYKQTHWNKLHSFLISLVALFYITFFLLTSLITVLIVAVSIIAIMGGANQIGEAYQESKLR